MGGYFDTKKLYRAVWAWLELQKHSPRPPEEYFRLIAEQHNFIKYEEVILLAYVRAWPPFEEKELGTEGLALYMEAKRIVDLPHVKNGNLGHCKRVLEKLQKYMLEKNLK